MQCWNLLPADDGESQALLRGAAQTAMLLDGVPGLLFVVKDGAGRYVSFNASLARRLGRREVERLLGRPAREIWPAALAQRYESQDDWVAQHRQPLLQQLDPILLAEGLPGWAVTHKVPLLNARGEQCGLLSLSRDIEGLARAAVDDGLIEAVDRMTKASEGRLTVAELSALAGMRPASFARLVRRIFGMGPMEFIVHNRVRAAALRLQGDESLAEIAQGCGFYDQAQFCRQFRRVMGLSPSQLREQVRRAPSPWLLPGLGSLPGLLSWAGCSSA
ncbi:helix-turn-helix domain-containing protein [Inhella proteolytica]|uniref:AraC family transcriptional regulator n=1 Tax=Inhella proteolytica TaxID=2795029 RepID=A0A931J7I9_9BURK|nr:AraC family transcriptional regulator [Inhella proteolytica]MBH9579223.1 AraC family transcriptional regulator [Inhella proteolytica]